MDENRQDAKSTVFRCSDRWTAIAVTPSSVRAMPVTLRDLAATIGVDVSTVSRALRDDPRVRAVTRERVHALAGELGYQPNLAARHLVTGHTGAVWLVLGGITSPIDYEPAQAASRACNAQGYDLHIVLHHGEPATLERAVSRLQQHVADGVLWVSSTLACEKKALSGLVAGGFPLVFLDRHVPSIPAATFTTDNAQCAARLIEQCKLAGCTSVVNLFGVNNPVERARQRGTLSAAKRLGMPVLSIDEIARTRGHLGLVATGPQPILNAVRKDHERFAGRSLVFACFDDWPGEPYPAERVFVCRQDFTSMAERATRYVLELIRGTAHSRAHVTTVAAQSIDVIAPRL